MKVETLIQTKTFWSGLSLVGFGIVQIVKGDQQNGIQSLLTGLSIIFLREGILKTGRE